MKKTLRMMGLCALAVLALAGCKKNEQKDTVTFKANLPQPACDAKTHIGSGNMLMWNAGDAIKVYTADKNEDNAATFTTTDANQTTAIFSGTLAESERYYAFYPTTGVELNTDGKFVLPVSATQTYVESNFTTNTFPMCATSTDGTFNFRSPYGILGIPMTGDATIGSIVLTDTTGMQLAGYYAMDATDTTFVGTGASITLDFGAGVTLNTTTPTTAYFIVPAGVFQSGFNAAVKGTDGSTIFNLGTIQPNTILKESIHLMPETTVNAAPVSTAPTGAIKGKFTIDDTGKQVWFAHGNLMCQKPSGVTWYDAADNNQLTWSFMLEQYYMVETELMPLDSNYANHDTISLFSWGTSGIAGTPNPSHPTIFYQPFETTFNQIPGYENAGAYYRNDVTDGPFGDKDWGNNTIQSKNGVCMPADGWRTPTILEWKGLFDRKTSDDHRCYGKATVNGVHGIIILPDDLLDSYATLGVTLETDGDLTYNSSDCGSWDHNVINGTAWSALEDLGVVFLPAAGQRYGYDRPPMNAYGCTSNGYVGNYWSCNGLQRWSSATHVSEWNSAYKVQFTEEFMYYYGQSHPYLMNWDSRLRGHSVRLIKDVE